ncbi:MAG: MBL fold metallo-hydrolase [Clostridia bacterium]|nr:MBL fold metallo-hydrolase [Clostridia bacterium]
MKTTLYMLKETSPYMMSFVITTERNRCIVIDGGRAEDMPDLKACIGGRTVAAWILTHPHTDHISGFVAEMEKNGCYDFDVERVYYRFPDYDAWVARADEAPDREYFLWDLNEMLPAFNRIRHRFAHKEHLVEAGEKLRVDEVEIEFLYTTCDGLFANPINDSSLVFKLSSPRKSVLFLGDLGPDGGDMLYRMARHKLKADVVQMAHHGHMNVSMEVYAAIDPKACLWSAPRWLYEEEEVPQYLADEAKLIRMKRTRMYGTAVTRRWMECLGVKEHYVSGDGMQTVLL